MLAVGSHLDASPPSSLCKGKNSLRVRESLEAAMTFGDAPFFAGRPSSLLMITIWLLLNIWGPHVRIW